MDVLLRPVKTNVAKSVRGEAKGKRWRHRDGSWKRCHGDGQRRARLAQNWVWRCCCKRAAQGHTCTRARARERQRENMSTAFFFQESSRAFFHTFTRAFVYFLSSNYLSPSWADVRRQSHYNWQSRVNSGLPQPLWLHAPYERREFIPALLPRKITKRDEIGSLCQDAPRISQGSMVSMFCKH